MKSPSTAALQELRAPALGARSFLEGLYPHVTDQGTITARKRTLLDITLA